MREDIGRILEGFGGGDAEKPGCMREEWGGGSLASWMGGRRRMDHFSLAACSVRGAPGGLQRPAVLMERLFAEHVAHMPAAVPVYHGDQGRRKTGASPGVASVAKAMAASPAPEFEIGGLVPTEAEFR